MKAEQVPQDLKAQCEAFLTGADPAAAKTMGAGFDFGKIDWAKFGMFLRFVLDLLSRQPVMSSADPTLTQVHGDLKTNLQLCVDSCDVIASQTKK